MPKVESTGDVGEILFDLIAEAAKDGNVERIEKLMIALKALGPHSNGSARSSNAGERPQSPIDQMPVINRFAGIEGQSEQQESSPAKFEPSRRSAALEQGRFARRDWLAEMERTGIILKPLHGQRLYKDAKGDRVGIAFANEQSQRHLLDKWWMGLPDSGYAAIVLLCRDLRGSIVDFILPKEFLSPLWHLFSRGGLDQVEFHVQRRGSNYALDIPGLSPQSINEFRSNYKCLRHGPTN